MAYGLRAEEGTTGKFYGRKCQGYAQTTDSLKCCKVGPYIRAVDCCIETEHVWFRVGALECHDNPDGVVPWNSRCWDLTDTILQTVEEIIDQYPGEPVSPAESLLCLTDCTDAECPQCDACCYIGHRTHSRCLNDCRDMSVRCNCGQEWTVTVNVTAVYTNRVCIGGDTAPGCNRVTMNFSGTVSWRYAPLVEDGPCELVMTACSGTMTETYEYLGFGSCTGATETYNYTYSMATPGPFASLIGCGQSPVTIAFYAFKDTIYAVNCSGFSPCGNDCYPCNEACHTECGNAIGQPGLHHVHNGTNTCSSKTLHIHRYDECDVGCALNDECTLDVVASVAVNVPCPDGDGGGIDPGGGDPGPGGGGGTAGRTF